MLYNIWDFVEKIEDWWPWHGNQGAEDNSNVNLDLNPVLLIPGIGGSIINAVNEKGNKERIWVRLFAADREFRTKLWSIYDKKTGKTESLDKTIKIEVPDDRHGLYGCDVLDPDIILRVDAVYYFHDVIEQMLSWGYQEGTTLFGFPYDFRQSNKLPERMDALKEKLKAMYEISGGKKANIISHSMGGLVVKCFLSLYPEFFEKYVNTWIAVTAPFQGAPGFIVDCLLTGVEFVKGWQRELFVAKWSMHQLLIECPAIYELMAAQSFNWSESPELRVWRQRTDGNGDFETELEAFGPTDCTSVMIAALQKNSLDYNGETIPVPLNLDILLSAMETRRVLDSAKLPKSVNFYNIFGTSFETPMHVCYGTEGSPLQSLDQILQTEAQYYCVDGDGTVPSESAMSDGLDAKARVGIPGDHRLILSDERLFRVLKHWLQVGDPDPFYDPVYDYVILPTRAEFERRKKQLVAIAAPDNDDDYVKCMDEEYVATVSAGATRAEAHAHVSRPKPELSADAGGCRCVEIDTVGVAQGEDAAEAAGALEEAVEAASEEALVATTAGKIADETALTQ